MKFVNNLILLRNYAQLVANEDDTKNGNRKLKSDISIRACVLRAPAFHDCR